MIRTLAARPATGSASSSRAKCSSKANTAPELHTACGITAAEAGLDLVLGVQGNARHLAAAACSGGVASLFLPDAEAAGHWLVQNLRPATLSSSKARAESTWSAPSKSSKTNKA